MADLSSRERVLPTLRREVQDVNLTMAAEVAARGVSIVHTGDDFAGDTGPLMSPTHFRSLFPLVGAAGELHGDAARPARARPVLVSVPYMAARRSWFVTGWESLSAK